MLFRSCFGDVTFATPEDVWKKFLKSRDFRNINRYFQKSCKLIMIQQPSFLQSRLPAKDCWRKALATTCHLWSMLLECETNNGNLYLYGDEMIILESRFVAILMEPLWKTICFLVKGTFYVENGLSMTRLETEDHDQYLLHATIGALCTCIRHCSNQHLKVVFDRVLALHPEQLREVGPLGRLPIEFAVANKGRFHQEIFYIWDGYLLVPPHYISTYILEQIIHTSPRSVLASSNDLLSLACENGHSWDLGLEELAQAAPSSVSLGSAGIRLAMCTSTSPMHQSPLNAASSRKIRKPWRRHHVANKKQSRDRSMLQAGQKGLYYNTIKGQRETLDCVYRLLRSDPSAIVNAVHITK